MKSTILAGFAVSCLVTVNAVNLQDPTSVLDENEHSSDLASVWAEADKAAIEETAVAIIAKELGSKERAKQTLKKSKMDRNAFLYLFNAISNEDDEPVVETVQEATAESISDSLYGLNQKDIADLMAMENEVVKAEIELAMSCDLTDSKCRETHDALEAERKEIVYQEKAIKTVMKQQEVDIKDEASRYCRDTRDAFTASIDEMSSVLAEENALTMRLADSLAKIDPNMENGDEGKAFLRKMYKLRGEKPKKTEVQMPETPIACVGDVAGKVIQIQTLQSELDRAASFASFFSQVYCEAYVNSIVTMTDGMSQIITGDLDKPIEVEIMRLQARYEGITFESLELAATKAFVDSIAQDLYIEDESMLLSMIDPMDEALDICGSTIQAEIKEAQQDRDDFIDDVNFLRYLKSL